MIAVFILILVVGLGLLFFVSANSARDNKKLAGHDFNPQIVQSRWGEITNQMQNPSGLKNALIEADKLFDYVLKGQGYRGETMAIRLKKAQSQLSNREAVWRAHKLRNSFVHEVNIDIVPAQIQSSVKVLGQAIKDLGIRL